MANNQITHKQSSVAGKAPTTAQLELGELAINTTDGKLFLKKNVLGTESVVEVGADNAPSAVTYAYDALGRVETTTETLPTGTRTTTVTYNEAGQVKTVTVTLGTSTRTTQYAYDQYGVLTGTTSTES